MQYKTTRILLVLAGLVSVMLFLNSYEVKGALAGSLSGKVLDLEGEPIKGATITLVNQKNPQGIKTAKANRKGRFRFVQINPGIYKVTAEADNYKLEVFQDLRVSANSRLKINFTLHPVEE